MMDEKEEKKEKKSDLSPLPEDDARNFFGTITASVTHELNNILSIIDQSAGLIEDFLASSDSGMQLTEEKLKQITEKIRKNSQRGIGVVKHLNSFAHSTDDPAAAFNANAMLENWVALTKRFADLKAVAMEIFLPDQQIEIRANAYLVRKILYEALKEILLSVQKNDKIKISLNSDGAEAVIIMEGLLAEMKIDSDFSDIEKLTTSAGGSVKAVIDGSKIEFLFRFPIFT